ncbi:MAG TPA: hypothetical protein PKL73_23430 [Polyangiaceae bacterium]|jgi:hypothetical protein|nr:hypothetical protein [Polyangiaceae bacterium]HNZ25237.1 hypothetical protein [Polyangiaceae bacterium]HOD25530.1 hypothetical protein [Polyangiaceae bacterium]HOH03358.1 hypothetical protein [Polyangiaceae bacterium]HOR37725.1 hypothetical protein [Polyangiaceae bacterium]
MADVSTSGKTHLVANLVLQILMLVGHLMLGIGAAVSAVLFFYGDAGWGPFATDAADAGRRTGNLLAIIALALWSCVGLVWTPLNAFGLWNRRPWARSSTSAYWLLSALTICLLPLSVYGLLSLARTDVREALEPDSN